MIELNDLETSRFGVVAAHVTALASGPGVVTRAADEAGVELLTVRIDANDLPAVRAFEGSGFRLMDTLVYYGRSTEKRPSVLRGRRATIRLARPSDVAAVGDVARVAFRSYMGRYHADPRLDDQAADAAYIDWAETSVALATEARPVIVAGDLDQVLGFATMRDVGSASAEIVLNAVRPSHQGQGIYSGLLAESVAVAARSGSERVFVSTQINNYAVQRAWARLGFAHERSLYTLHKWFDRSSSADVM